MNTTTRFAVAATSIGIVAALAGSVATGSGNTVLTGTPTQTPAVTSLPAVSSYSSSQAHDFIAFGRVATAEDSIGLAAQAKLKESHGITASGANPKLARRVTSDAASVLFVMPAAGGVCLAMTTPSDGALEGAGCGPNDSESRLGAFILTRTARGVDVIGLAPTGASAAVVTGPEAPLSVPVTTSGGFALSALGDPTDITFTGAGGMAVREALDAPVPPPSVAPPLP